MVTTRDMVTARVRKLMDDDEDASGDERGIS